MKLFLSSKLVAAKPMALGEYNAYRGWTIPDNEDPAREGYLVEYIGSGDKNHDNHDHYISWSPKETFDAGNIPVGGEEALALPPHLQRLAAEFAQQVDRLTKLQGFYGTPIHESLSAEEKADLVLQDTLMSRLNEVLDRRLKRATQAS